MSKPDIKKPVLYREERDTKTPEHQRALSLIKEAGELVKPYGAEVLGMVTFFVAVRHNLMLGQGEIFFPKISTGMNVSQDVAKLFATSIRDESLAMLGMKMTSMRPGTVEEKEEKKEIEALTKEQGLQ